MTPTTRRRRRLLLVVASLLAALEVSGALLASAVIARSVALSAAPEATAAREFAVSGVQSGQPPSPWLRLAAELPLPEELWRTLPARRASDVFERRDPAPLPTPTPKPTPSPTPTPAPAGVATTAAAGGLAGASRTVAVVTNRLRIPDLRIDRTTRSYPCDRAEPPDNYVYRWGCAGRNNLYLLGHAATVFKPLHDAYVAGKLRVGMAAWYTDAKGKTRRYRVTTWRIVKPTDAAWAIASQPVPSMTLQTCYGRNNEYRLLVRLVAG